MQPKPPHDREPHAPGRGQRAEEMLAAAGLRAVRVERCPDPACPLCPRAGRAAA